MDNGWDHLIDARLRDVPLPEGLLERLREAVGPEDAEIDALLKGVVVRQGLRNRLQRSASEAVLDEALADVDVPPGLLARCHVIPEVRRRRVLARMSAAACLMVLLAGAQLLTVLGLLGAVRPEQAPSETLAVMDFGPLDLVAEQLEPVTLVATSRSEEREWPPLPPARPITIDQPLDRPIPPGAAGDWIRAVATGLDPGGDVLLLRWGLLGAPHFGDRGLPDLERVAGPRGRGVEFPSVPGYDRRFAMRHGAHPPISPASHPRLETARVPLWTDCSGFDRAARRVSQGRLPDPQEIAVEDFLAAVDYRLAAAEPGQLALRTAAGPALLAGQTHELLLVGVKAGPLRDSDSRGTHLTIALDVSSSMNWGDRLAVARQAIRELGARLGPHDYLSLVAFDHEVVRELELVRRGQPGEIEEALAPEVARGGDNLAAGVQRAVSVALGAGLADDVARRLVVITDARAVLDHDDSRRVQQLLLTAGSNGLDVTVLDIGDQPDSSALLLRLMEAADGRVVRVGAVDDLRWRLLEQLRGRPAVIARDAWLHVTFNPEAVLAYRLVGHDATALTALLSSQVPADLHAGEETVVLFEVWLRPNGVDDVAWAELRWTDPESGLAQRGVQQRISRLQFVPSLAESSLALQAALVAAEAAQVLDGSFDFALGSAGRFSARRKPGHLRDVLDAAGELNPRLMQRPEFQHFVEFLRQLEALRSGKAAGPTDSSSSAAQAPPLEF